MSSSLVNITQAVFNAIKDKLDNTTSWPSKSRWGTAGDNTPGFVHKGWEIERTWLPYQKLQDIPEKGKVWIIGMAADDGNSKGRGNTSLHETPVMVGFQTRVQTIDNTTLDTLVEFQEQLREVCRLEVDPDQNFYSWLRTESLSDGDGTPYSFVGLRESSVFEVYFTAYFNYTLP